jgi:sialic acid synthase SpsE/spore coat polysaccharide biosynthesis protein SpsF (cytidylyltransferase family)
MKIIAESAYNHQGNFDYLKQLALAAKKANADFFTVQMMNVEEFCTKEYSKYQLYKDTEFTESQWQELFEYCKVIQIDLIPCTLEKVSFDLAYNFGYRLVKIHGTDLTNDLFLTYIKEKGDCRIILETQCSTDYEIKRAVEKFGDIIDCLFHGFSNYPTEPNEQNLLALNYLKNRYNLPTGFADHSLDTQIIPCMVMALGCSYLEKHITINRSHRQFDYQVSLEPHEFSILVNTILHYKQTLGKPVKHPVKSEKGFRNILFKKYFGNGIFKRDNEGKTFIESEIDTFDKTNVTAALIARLKSKRLKLKVMKPFGEHESIVSLYERLKANCKNIRHIELATSYLLEDEPLADLFEKKELPHYEGHPESVIDRLLEVAIKNKSAAVFRVTGDNPFTDPILMDRMVAIFQEQDVDYVRVNNVPFGISAELFKTSYLWKLYLKMEDPFVSEYLSWFVLNDEECDKACIEFKDKRDFVKYVNLSIDYPEDYEYATEVLTKINKIPFNSITLNDVLKNISNKHVVDVSKAIKLPGGVNMLYSDYMTLIDTTQYVYKETYSL